MKTFVIKTQSYIKLIIYNLINKCKKIICIIMNYISSLIYSTKCVKIIYRILKKIKRMNELSMLKT